ncbi:hypothetical protein [Rhodococcus pyridinivorans]|nr:hypothetical protein [Rhodococcus pyridinivorans]USI90604.1 hypothetical protein LLA01_01225 [Rhodococcus pyridinivorans]
MVVEVLAEQFELLAHPSRGQSDGDPVSGDQNGLPLSCPGWIVFNSFG